MGIYIRNNRYYFKKEIHGKKYYRALKLKRGQEALLSARLKQVEEEVLAKHFGIPYSPNNQISFLDYAEKYLNAKKNKKRWERDKQSLLKIAECLGDPSLFRIAEVLNCDVSDFFQVEEKESCKIIVVEEDPKDLIKKIVKEEISKTCK